MMRRTNPPEQRQIINTRLNPDLWHEFRKRALEERRPTFMVLEDAIRMYLKAQSDD
jgi:hypothetical protein